MQHGEGFRRCGVGGHVRDRRGPRHAVHQCRGEDDRQVRGLATRQRRIRADARGSLPACIQPPAPPGLGRGSGIPAPGGEIGKGRLGDRQDLISLHQSDSHHRGLGTRDGQPRAEAPRTGTAVRKHALRLQRLDGCGGRIREGNVDKDGAQRVTRLCQVETVRGVDEGEGCRRQTAHQSRARRRPEMVIGHLDLRGVDPTAIQ